MEGSTMIHGKIHELSMVIFNSYVTNYQRVLYFQTQQFYHYHYIDGCISMISHYIPIRYHLKMLGLSMVSRFKSL